MSMDATKFVTLPYPPPLNNLYATVRGRRVLSREGRAYKQTAAAHALTQGMRPLDGNLTVFIEVHRPRKAGDLDNSFKAAFDALKGIAWHDDSQVCRIVADRFDDKDNPRVQIEVVPWVADPSRPQVEAK